MRKERIYEEWNEIWTKYIGCTRESSGRTWESERVEGCWLTLGQCRRGAVAFGSWLWRVHNAYCQATHHTNVCADASTQRVLAISSSISYARAPFIRRTCASVRRRIHVHTIFLFRKTPSFLVNSRAFGKANKIPPRWRNLSDIDFLLCLYIFLFFFFFFQMTL